MTRSMVLPSDAAASQLSARASPARRNVAVLQRIHVSIRATPHPPARLKPRPTDKGRCGLPASFGRGFGWDKSFDKDAPAPGAKRKKPPFTLPAYRQRRFFYGAA